MSSIFKRYSELDCSSLFYPLPTATTMGQASVLCGLDSSSGLLTGPSASALVLSCTPLLPQQPEWALLGHELDGVPLLFPSSHEASWHLEWPRGLCTGRQGSMQSAPCCQLPQVPASLWLRPVARVSRNTLGTFYLGASVPPPLSAWNAFPPDTHSYCVSCLLLM